MCAGVCWNSNSNTVDFLQTPRAQQAPQLFVLIKFHNHPHCDLSIQAGPLQILRTECIQRVSKSLFPFYIDYPSQK